MKDKQELLQNGAVGKVIFSLAIPSVIITLVLAVYNMADVFFIGRTGNADMVNAIAVCMPIFTIIQAIGTLVGMGGCTAVTLALSQKDYQKTKQITCFGFWFCVFVGAVVTIGTNLFLPQLLRLLGAADASLTYAATYLRILSFGAPIMMFSNSFVNILRADGSVKESMIANLTGTFVNIILDPIMIFGMNMGVGGAAAATLLGNAVASAMVLYYIIKRQEIISISPKDLSMNTDVTLRTLLLGLPVASGTMLLSFAYMLMNNQLLSIDANAQGAFGICRSLMLFSTMIQMGICAGVQPAVTYNYGKKNSKRVKEFILKTGGTAMCFGLVAAVLCISFRDMLLGAFIDNAEIAAYGRVLVVGCFCSAPVYAIYQTAVTFLQATDRPTLSTIVTILRQGLIIMPAMLVLRWLFGFAGLSFAFAVTDIIAAIIGGILLAKRMKEI